MDLTHSTIDYDECMDNNGNCSQHCVNEVPGHRCTCDDGYLSQDGGRECIGSYQQNANDAN